MLLRACGKEVAFDVVLVFSCGIHQASWSAGLFLDRLSCLSFRGLYTPVPIFRIVGIHCTHDPILLHNPDLAT